MTDTTSRGHGGAGAPSRPMNPGAVGSGTTEYKEVSWINDQFLATKKPKDASDYKAGSVNQNLVNIVYNTNAISKGSELTFSHHMNAFNGKATGVEVWYYLGDPKGKALAEKLSAAISKALGLPNRGAKATVDLYVVAYTNATCLLIEWCFVDNASDMRAYNKNKVAAVNAALNVIGYGAPTPAKAEYWDQKGWYEVTEDVTSVYTSTWFDKSKLSGYRFGKKSRFYCDEVVWNQSKTARRAKIAALGNSGPRYVTLNKAYVKKV